MSAPPRSAWQAQPEHSLECELLGLCARATAERAAPARIERIDRILEDARRARARSQAILAAGACLAALLAGLWAGSPQINAPIADLPRGLAAPAGPVATLVSRELACSSQAILDEAEVQDWRLLELAGVGRIEFSGIGGQAIRELASERQLTLQAGVLRAQISRQDPLRPLVVATPDVRVVVVGTRFDVFAERGRTRVEVIDGHVRVEAGLRSVELSGGEAVQSDDPRLAPQAPAAPQKLGPSLGTVAVAPRPRGPATRPPAAVGSAPAARRTLDDCDRLETLVARADCLRGLTSGDSLEAQEALLALGALVRDAGERPARAIEIWRDYEARFPAGAFGPEVELNLFETLLLEDRLEEALTVAATFERRFPRDPRTPRLALEHARLLCGKAGERARGRQRLDAWSAGADPELKAAIEAVRARCEGPSFGPSGPGGLVPRDVLRTTSPPGD